MNVKEIFNYILAFTLGGVFTYLYFYYVEISSTAVLNQHNAALNDSLVELESKNFWLSRKIAEVSTINEILKDSLAIKDELVLTLTRQILHFKKLVEENTGEVSVIPSVDTAVVGGGAFSLGVSWQQQLTGCKGLLLHFSKENVFYTYSDSVWIDTPPRHKLELNFAPLSFDVYLSRNKDGIWSNYYKLPVWAKDYLSLSDVNVSIDVDEYVRVSSSNSRRFNLFADAMVQVTPENTWFFLGGSVIINDTYKFTYGKRIDNSGHLLQVGYSIFHIK